MDNTGKGRKTTEITCRNRNTNENVYFGSSGLASPINSDDSLKVLEQGLHLHLLTNEAYLLYIFVLTSSSNLYNI